MDLEEIKTHVSDLNYQIANRGLKAVDSRTGQQKTECWLPESIKKILEAEWRKERGYAIIKYFNPTGIGTWYISEFDGKDMFYGLCELHMKEYGYVSLNELRTTQVRFGLWIERDFWFTPCTLKEAREL